MFRFIKLSPEAQSAADWCAFKGYDGRDGSPLPSGLSNAAWAEICANKTAFALCVHLNATRRINQRRSLASEGADGL